MPHFLKIVVGFRRKFSTCDEDFIACYSRISYMGTRQACGQVAGIAEAEYQVAGDCVAL